MRNLKYYKSEKGLYITQVVKWSGNVAFSESTKINGKKWSPTTSKSWVFVDGESEILKIEDLGQSKRTNCRYELTNKDLVSDKIPLVIMEDDLETEECEDYGDDIWVGKYAGLNSMYEFKYDIQKREYESVEFEAEIVGEIVGEFSSNPIDARYGLNYDRKQTEKCLTDLIQYEEFERFMTPEFGLQHRPCYISSVNTYKMVRSYIKNNIDPAVAEITSDYDFCFTVKKKIRINPYVTKREITKTNGKSYAKPRFKEWTTTHEKKEIFEMTDKKRCYQGYTPIDGFSGNNIYDLKENVDLFFKELMLVINEPLMACECCNGSGIVKENNK